MDLLGTAETANGPSGIQTIRAGTMQTRLDRAVDAHNNIWRDIS